MTARNFTLVFATLLLLSSCNMKNKGEDFDVSKSLSSDELMTDSTTLANMPVYSTTDAGASVNIERAFENAPPMIPHKINMFVPITTTSNLCYSCHKPGNANNIGATPMPNTHFTNYRPEIYVLVDTFWYVPIPAHDVYHESFFCGLQLPFHV